MSTALRALILPTLLCAAAALASAAQPAGAHALPQADLADHGRFAGAARGPGDAHRESSADGAGVLPPIAPPPADGHFASAASTSGFLARASFGARPQDLRRLTGGSASAWFLGQLRVPMSRAADDVDAYVARFDAGDGDNFLHFLANTLSFWKFAVTAPDQLRQRMAFALSQIFVVSDAGGAALSNVPAAIAYYRDILATHAFGNYRDLLEAITRSPAMGYYLTYLGNRPADPDTGRMPDENYAREILQLFSIGLTELHPDGSPVLDGDGEPLETYDNDDVTGLARVFTGFRLDEARYGASGDPERSLHAAAGRPMALADRLHSSREKSFLGLTIPADTGAEESLRLALDHIAAHPNVGPFIGRQLIQRFTTSDPSPVYVAAVSAAFDSGRYILPDNRAVGSGRRGDLAATLAAVLFAAPAHGAGDGADLRFGRLREPVLRFTQWARAFGVDAAHPEYRPLLFATDDSSALSQHPYRAPSVFNFYRPGFVPPGTLAGDAGMTVPEMQLVNASSTPGYVNFMTAFVFEDRSDRERVNGLAARFAQLGLPFDRAAARRSFVPAYERELALADDPPALVAHLDRLLAHGELEDGTRAAIADFIADIPMTLREPSGPLLRVAFAVLMTLTAPEYLVQR